MARKSNLAEEVTQIAAEQDDLLGASSEEEVVENVADLLTMAEELQDEDAIEEERQAYIESMGGYEEEEKEIQEEMKAMGLEEAPKQAATKPKKQTARRSGKMSRLEGFVGQEKKTFTDREDIDWQLITIAQRRKWVMRGQIVAYVPGKKVRDQETGQIVEVGGLITATIFNSNNEPLPKIRGVMPTEEFDVRPWLGYRRTVGRIISFRIMGQDREHKIAAISRKKALEDIAPATWAEISVGQVRPAVIRNIQPTYAIVDLGGVPGIIPRKEWPYRGQGEKVLEVNDLVDALVTEMDQVNMRVVLSIRQLLPDPWKEVPEKFRQGGTYIATVVGRLASGRPLVELDRGVLGLLPLNPATRDLLPGQEVSVNIIRIDMETHRITCSLVGRL